MPDDEPIRHLTAWSRTPHLSAKYFGEGFLHFIGEKNGKLIRVDRTMAYVERGRFTRESIEVDLSKPLYLNFCLQWQSLNSPI